MNWTLCLFVWFIAFKEAYHPSFPFSNLYPHQRHLTQPPTPWRGRFNSALTMRHLIQLWKSHNQSTPTKRHLVPLPVSYQCLKGQLSPSLISVSKANCPWIKPGHTSFSEVSPLLSQITCRILSSIIFHSTWPQHQGIFTSAFKTTISITNSKSNWTILWKFSTIKL